VIDPSGEQYCGSSGRTVFSCHTVEKSSRGKSAL
jgi:hypothetical protein